MNDHETIGQELVKCVLVGDTATGKTRLVCARALNARVSLKQLLRQHVSTVWAIDQYRIYKEVLERSISIVDGVQVSIRLWDTFAFGDRRFAYGKSDVILLCFSIGNKNSLQHCKTVWFPEIRRFCPDTPIVLVGCKNDLRFLCKDPTYLEYCRDRSPFIRPTRECDVVMPEQARAFAKEFGLPYYETSVFTYYGVNQVFENAIRCALITRRNQRFWMTNLKHVQQPLLQAPYCPPKKDLNEIVVFPGTFASDMKDVVSSKPYADLVFITGTTEINAHRFVIAAASQNLASILEPDSPFLGRRNSDISTTSESTVDDTECLIKTHQSSKSEGHINFVSTTNSSFLSDNPEFDWKANNAGQNNNANNGCNNNSNKWIESTWTRADFDDVKITQVVLKINDRISSGALRALLYFIYTGELSIHTSISYEAMKTAAEIFGNKTLNQYLDAWFQRDVKMMTELRKTYKYNLRAGMWRNCRAGYYTDVTFQLEDGRVAAHRAILMSRSEVMRAMFSRDFVERTSPTVSIQDVKQEVFLYFLEYLYTDSVTTPVPSDVGMRVLELANRLCLTRLVNYLENLMVSSLIQKQNHGIDVMECCIRLLEPAQLHNIDQLAQWCLIQLATNYDLVCRKHGKSFKELHSENRQWISQYRWPPVWYVKDFDCYQKALIERYKIEHPEKKARKRNNSGCLCFSGKSRKNVSEHKHSEVQKMIVSAGSICF